MTFRAERALVAALVGTGLLVGVARAIDGEAFTDRLLGADPRGVALAAAMIPVQVALAATRWRAASASLGVPVAGVESFAEAGLATLLNQLLPSGLAGEVARVWRQRGAERPTARIVAAALTDRGLGLAAFLLVLAGSLASWPLVHRGVPPIAPVGAASALAAAGGLALAMPGAWPWVGRVAGHVRRAAFDRGRRWTLALTSAGFIAAIFVQAGLCAWALGLSGGAGLASLLPLYLLAMLVPLSVGGWGPKEAAALGLFPLIGWSGPDAVAFSALFGLTTLLGSAPFAVAGLR